MRALREADSDFVLQDIPLAECDRLGDGRADYSAKHRRHGVCEQRRSVRPPFGRTAVCSQALS